MLGEAERLRLTRSQRRKRSQIEVAHGIRRDAKINSADSMTSCEAQSFGDSERRQVLSLIVVVVPFVFTDAMPPSRLDAEAYIWLDPMIWWLAAFRLK